MLSDNKITQILNEVLPPIWDYIVKHTEDVSYASLGILSLIKLGEHPYALPIQRAIEKIIEYQDKSTGGWVSEVSDTAFAIRAVYLTKPKNYQDVIKRGYEFIKNEKDERSKSWMYELWSTIFVCMAILETNYENFYKDINDTTNWLLSRQLPDGSWISPYLTGLAALLLKNIKKRKLCNVDEIILDNAIESAVTWLITNSEKFSDNLWSDLIWVNAYALYALLSLDEYIKDKKILDKIAESLVESFLLEKEKNRLTPIGYPLLALVLYKLLRNKRNVKPFRFRKKQIAYLSLIDNESTDRLRISLTKTNTDGVVSSTPVKQIDVDLNYDFIEENLFLPLENLLYKQILMENINLNELQENAISKRYNQFFDTVSFMFDYFNLSEIVESLERLEIDFVRLVPSNRMIHIPWELLFGKGHYLGLRYSFGRVFDSTAYNQVRHKDPLKILLVGDNISLKYAEKEINSLRKILEQFPNMSVTAYFTDAHHEEKITKLKLLRNLSEYDIIHYAGHIERDKKNPEKSFITLGDEEVNFFELLRFVKKPPLLFFMNACSSVDISYLRGGAFSLARLLINRGVPAFIGTLYPIRDITSTEIAIKFYEYLSKGYPIGESLRFAKIDTISKFGIFDLTWGAFVLYGDPTITII